MNEMTEQVPNQHGGMFFHPPIAQWKEEALRNRERLVKETFWGLSPMKVREAYKLPTAHPLILSGHQPVFFHPGLWVKCLAASILAEAVQGSALHKVTDTALAPEHLHCMPEVEEDGHSRRKILDFYSTKDHQSQERTTPYCYLPAPDEAAFNKVFADAQVYAPPLVKTNVKAYEAKLRKGFTKTANWNSFHLNAMNILDDLCGTHRFYLEAHKLWANEPFYHFLAQWLKNLPELNDDYNKSLNEYRQKHGITHDLNPMPNLKFEDWWFEIPFWGATKYHQRHSLWAKNDGKHITLKLQGGDGTFQVSTEDTVEELSRMSLTVWPKAIPQTLFCRMYLCDFFIHGVGGGAYEEVGDLVFTKFFKLKPLSYGVATATYLVDPEGSRSVDLVAGFEPKISWWSRALEKNPEYLFIRQDQWKKELPSFMQEAFKKALDDPYLRSLAEAKGKWIEALQNPTYKTQASYKIKEINHVLFERYTEPLKALEKGLLDVEKVRKTKDVLGFREYPFFCYPPEIFSEMHEKVREAAHGPEPAKV